MTFVPSLVRFSPVLAVSIALAAPATGVATRAATLDAARQAQAWEIGPVTPRRNFSVNMPLQPSPHPRGGFYFDIPYPNRAAGHVHYVTFRHGSLAGKSRIVMRYRLETAPGVELVPTKERPGIPSILSIYFQRRGDNWSGRGPFEAYRWYSTFRTHSPIRPGERELVVGLNESWSAVQTSYARTNPAGFRAAIQDADRVGFVFGGGDGFGHGVYATGPARFVVTSFRVL